MSLMANYRGGWRLARHRPTAVQCALAVVLVLVLLAGGAAPAYAWTAPGALNNNAETDAGSESYPQVTTDGGGNWVAVWQSTENLFDPNLGDTIGTDQDILVSRSTDNGAVWTDPAALNTSAASDLANDDDPQVTTDGAGNWLAVWHSQDDLDGSIGFDQDILVSRSTDNGASWTAQAALNTNATTDEEHDDDPQVTTDGGGNWVAVWDSTENLFDPNLGDTIGTDHDILVARSTDNGATWTDPAALNTNAATDSSGGDYYPQLTTDGAGNWLAVWESYNDPASPFGTDYDILMARSADNGATWADPAALNTNAATDSLHDHYPQVTTDEAGNWVAVWRSNEDLFDPNLGANIGTDWDILTARSTDNGAAWTTPAALNTNAATDSGSDDFPQVTTDDAGNWMVAWHSRDDLGGSIETDWDILRARSTDNGATWTTPAALNTNAATDEGADRYPQATTDDGGNWVVVWRSTENLGGTIGTDWDILCVTCSPLDVDCPGADDDGDGVVDLVDNCPEVPNEDQADDDGEGLGNACDPCPGDSDCDDDEFTDFVESYLDTDPLDDCPDDPSDDAWPFDINVDTWSNILDVLLYKGHLQTQVGDPDYDQRLDLNADAWVDILDILLYKGDLQIQCTNP